MVLLLAFWKLGELGSAACIGCNPDEETYDRELSILFAGQKEISDPD